jgi:putative endonuclease
MDKKNNHRTIGTEYEKIAETFLNQQGFKTFARNFYSRFGELDLVMLQQDTLLFVEVRYRKNSYFGTAIETVTASKQQKLLKTAKYFLLKHPQFQQHACRFDIIGISPVDGAINWLENAFGE